jgi:tetratricopeptide (TPR) repeat protein
MSTEMLLERARLLLDQGRTNDAIKEVKQFLQKDPENDEALSLFARCLYEKNEISEGIEIVLQAIRIDPENSFYFYLLAFGYYKKDEHFAALDNLNRAISLNPYNPEYYGLSAFVHLEEKDFKLALEKADEGLALDPENITCLNARSTALNKLKRTDDAIETMQDALAQDPDNEFTHATVGWNFLEKGKHKDAAKHFREALRINPGHRNARAGLKEALKSKIPPYKWLLQYSFWVNNKGKKARWIVPIALYITVRALSGALGSNESTAFVGSIIIALYLVFVVTSWIINPLANFFLLFHRDGKYALDLTERWTAITVVTSLVLGCIAFLPTLSMTTKDEFYPPFSMIAVVFWLMAMPLGDIQYPLSFKNTGTANKAALILVATGLLTIMLAFLYFPAAIITGAIFLIGFILNNWLGIFR